VEEQILNQTNLKFLIWALLFTVGISVAFAKNLYSCAILASIVSFLIASLFLLMAAPDVAITEAAVGAAISTIFFFICIKLTGKESKTYKYKSIFAAILCIGLFVILGNYALALPEYGSAISPANSGVASYYMQNAYAETGIQNIVTAVLGSYRGFDTFGEVFVILTAGLSVGMLLSSAAFDEKKSKNNS